MTVDRVLVAAIARCAHGRASMIVSDFREQRNLSDALFSRRDRFWKLTRVEAVRGVSLEENTMLLLQRLDPCMLRAWR
jgi:hypothetical protein